jgi:membrane protease subunit HflK
MTQANEKDQARGMHGWTLAEKAAATAVVVNVVLTILKFALAFWSKSLALRVEAFHSLADIGSSVAVFMAVRAEMPRRRALSGAGEKTGLFANPQRLVAVSIGVFLLVIGLLFVRKVIAPEAIVVAHPVPVSIAMLVLALFSFLLSRFERFTGDKERCTALVADSYHARVDMFGSLVVAGSLLGEGLGWRVDRLAAGLLALFVISQALNVFGAVIRDIVKKEERTELLYREAWWLAIRQRVPELIPRLMASVVRFMGGSIDSTEDRKRARIIMIGTALIFVFALYLSSGFFTVGPSERAIVEHLGKPVNPEEPLAPGLHWRWPRPIDRARKVDVQGIRTLMVGSAVSPERRTVLWTNQHYVEQFNVLSGENIFVDVGVVLHYRVSDAFAWLYSVGNPEHVLSYVTYSVLTEELSGLEFLETITTGRDDLEARLTERVVDSLGRYRTGIKLLSLQVRDIHPPTNVAPDFENVVSATVEYETKINEARGYANDLIPRARGEAVSRVLSAKAERIAGRNRARGDAGLFNGVREAYRASPEVARVRFKVETAERVLPGRQKVLVPGGAVPGAIELFAPINSGPAPSTGKSGGNRP